MISMPCVQAPGLPVQQQQQQSGGFQPAFNQANPFGPAFAQASQIAAVFAQAQAAQAAQAAQVQAQAQASQLLPSQFTPAQLQNPTFAQFASSQARNSLHKDCLPQFLHACSCAPTRSTTT